MKRYAKNETEKQMEEFYLEKMREGSDYQKWIERQEESDSLCEDLEYQPRISVIVSVYNVQDKHLIPCIESVLHQSYTNWELCMADDCSTWGNVRDVLKSYEDNEKIHIVYRNGNGHISRCTNSALEAATGEFIAFLDCDDLLVPHALYEVAKVLNKNPDLDFIYSDEDKIDDDGERRFMPHFKSDWSPDTLMANMYTCHLGVYRRTIAMEIGGLRVGYEGAQDYDFTLRFTERTDKIAHIPKILYHWRVRDESTAGATEAKPYVVEAGRKSQEDALVRRGLRARLEPVPEMPLYRPVYECDPWPKVSVVIPSKDNYEILETCIRTFHEITDYPDYEIILVDNGSSALNKKKYQRLADEYGFIYLYQYEKFNFSHMCNTGSRAASGEYILLLNDDIEIIHADWLKRMVGQAALPHVGAVGAKLLYPDRKTIQHIGIVNLRVGPAHAFTGFSDEPNHKYYFGINRLDYNPIAVTGACLLVSRKKYEEVSGFSEELAVSYNDVEFCFHLLRKGYYNVLRNDVILIHHESVSRGNDLLDQSKIDRLMREQRKLYDWYPEYRGRDPFYNVNLVQNKIDFTYNDASHIGRVNEKAGKPDGAEDISSEADLCVDTITFEDCLCISGWFFWKDSYLTNNCTLYLALQDRFGHAVYYTVDRKLREDVVQHLENVAYNSGFECRISYEDFRFNEEEYRIGFVIVPPDSDSRKVAWSVWKTKIVSEELYLSRVTETSQILNQEDAAGTDDYILNIDQIDTERCMIKGWALNPGSEENDYENFRIACEIGDNVVLYPVIRRKRYDVAVSYIDIPHAFWCGFECYLPKTHIKELDTDKIRAVSLEDHEKTEQGSDD
ncbi:MAG: glycosyltransferase [Lachnospiraceae bacterium]|nr:glycosyltransferase [Lachnospiraceae bacterium]